MSSQKRYMGSLKGFEIDNIDENFTKYLLDNNIFYIRNKYFDEENEENKLVKQSIQPTTVFSGYLFFNQQEYVVNGLILEEIYEDLRFYIEDIRYELKSEIFFIKTKLQSFIDKEKKIKYLADKYKRVCEKLRKSDDFNFKINPEDITELYEFTYKNYIMKYIEEADQTYLREYLVEGIKTYKTPIVEQWSKFYSLKITIEFLRSEYERLCSVNINKERGMDTSQQVLLLESLITHRDSWQDLSATKKSRLVSKLIDKNDSNIKKVYLEIDKKASEYSSKLHEDIVKISNLIGKDLG